MKDHEKPWDPSPDEIRQLLVRTVEYVSRKLRHQAVVAEFHQLRQLLDSLPLTSGEYATATNRVRNAAEYVVSQECGAARYELRMLCGMLRRDDTCKLRPAHDGAAASLLKIRPSITGEASA